VIGDDVLQFKNTAPQSGAADKPFDFVHATVSLERANVDGGVTANDLVMHINETGGASVAVVFQNKFTEVASALGHNAGDFAGGTVNAGPLTNVAATHHDWLIHS
jgi:hypothetical protein